MRRIRAYYGNGRGKSSAAFGFGIQQAAHGRDVILIQFLKQKDDAEFEYCQRLEPEIRFFRFQKAEELFEELPPDRREDEIKNMKNGLNYARKVLQTGECDLLILDEVLGLVDHGIISDESLLELLQSGNESTEVIVTGRTMPPRLMPHLECVYEIQARRRHGKNCCETDDEQQISSETSAPDAEEPVE